MHQGMHQSIDATNRDEWERIGEKTDNKTLYDNDREWISLWEFFHFAFELIKRNHLGDTDDYCVVRYDTTRWTD